MGTETNPNVAPELVDQVEFLNGEVRLLAMNLAIYLARAKKESDRINKLEPDFIRLVNGTVKVVQELTRIIHAARNEELHAHAMKVERTGSDPIEMKLQSILDQCNRIMVALSTTPEKSDENKETP